MAMFMRYNSIKFHGMRTSEAQLYLYTQNKYEMSNRVIHSISGGKCFARYVAHVFVHLKRKKRIYPLKKFQVFYVATNIPDSESDRLFLDDGSAFNK